MNSDSNQTNDTNGSRPLSLVNRFSRVRLKKEGEKILLILSPQDSKEPKTEWSEIEQELKYRLNNSENFWQSGDPVHLVVKDRLLDSRQLQNIDRALKLANLELNCICTSRRQTAVVAATSGYNVQQISAERSLEGQGNQTKELSEPLYLQNTIRSGVEVRHSGSIILLGDLNPGGSAIAAGDIIVWGCLKGVAHAGAAGNRFSRIMALKMQPTQLRIADLVARAPEKSPDQIEPEIAYIAPEGIHLCLANNFARVHSFSEEIQAWVDN